MSSPYAHMNQELLAIVSEDQAERQTTNPPPDLKERDRARRERVRGIVAEGGLHNADDYLAAALVFQHGETADDFRMAYELAWKAKEAGHQLGPWLYGVAMDRHLLIQARPVKYGAQFVQLGGVYRVPRFDPTTMDEERVALGLPTLAEAFAMDTGRGRPASTELGVLENGGLRVKVLSLARELTWHSRGPSDRTPADRRSVTGRSLWTNSQGWYWAENADGSLALGWLDLPYFPAIGHMVAQAESAQLQPAEVGGFPAIWVATGSNLWTLYAQSPFRPGETVWAVTGQDRDEVMQQMADLLQTP